jgi:hypothetical protein
MSYEQEIHVGGWLEGSQAIPSTGNTFHIKTRQMTIWVDAWVILQLLIIKR